FCFSSRRRHTRSKRDWSSDVCSSDLTRPTLFGAVPRVWEKLKAALQAGYPGDAVADSVANPQVAQTLRAKIGLDEAQWVVTGARSEERRVGKESRRAWRCHTVKTAVT